jgi:hypothetical protein
LASMAILSVDLAYKRYVDIGAVVMERSREVVECDLLDCPRVGEPSCGATAEWLNDVCLRRGIRIVLLDGPQGWKAVNNGLLHSRCCERKLNTPAKTGEPFSVKPSNYGPFVKFSISVYEEMTSLGWERLQIDKAPTAERLLVESFPMSAWKSLKIPHLPAKAKKPILTWWIDVLRDRRAVRASRMPTHDQLQAIVSGLAGLAIESNRWGDCAVAGVPPVYEGGYWREGYIVNPL